MAKAYSASMLKVLEGLDAVRMRPGMYIGSTGSRGLHHLLWEIVDNAIDEVANGYARSVRVELHKDGSASVEDDGRGVPVDIHPELGITGVEMIYTQLGEMLKNAGLEHIEVEGQPFDPNFHQAVMRVQNPDLDDDTIAQELQKGYMVKGKVIRPSMVQVVSNS